MPNEKIITPIQGMVDDPMWFTRQITLNEDIKSRLRTYQTSSPLRNYKIEYYIHHPDCYGAEKDIHEQMKYFATNIKNEWFEIGSLQMVIDRLDESLQPREKISLDLYKK